MPEASPYLETSIDQGVLETLEEWPLCPNCESSQGATLVQYVRFKLL